MNDRLLPRREFLAMAAGAAAMSTLPSAAFGGQGTVPALPSRQNLILFFTDELRADALSCYGNPVCKTPNFDRFARQGTRFSQCHVQFPVCGASRCSLLTGWPTSVRGHRSLYYFLRPDEPNMFRYLKNAGYDVFWFGKNDALATQSFADSVTMWKDEPVNLGINAAAMSGPRDPNAPLTMLFPGGGDRRKTSDYALLQDAIKILDRREKDRPFCIFLPLFEPHPPYVAPADFDTMYKPADLPPLVPPGLTKKPLFHSEIRRFYGLDKVSDATLRQVRATYYGQVSYADWVFGEMLEALERTGHASDTAVVVSSDHGDYAGDYGLVEKWPSGLETCLTNVPLIARVPGGARGHEVNEMVELYDIMPTFLDLARTRATHTHFAKSLIPQIHGKSGDPNRAAFSEGGYNTTEPQAFEPKLPGLYAPKTNLQNDIPATVSRVASVKTLDYTYIARPGGVSELYDRKRDPQERRNLIDERSMHGVREDLRARLLNRYIETTGVPPTDKDPRDLPPFYPTPTFPEGQPAS